MATTTSTTVKTVYRDGKKIEVKTVTITKPDGVKTTETFVQENEMEEDRVKDEFASFKRRLESRPGKDNERTDAGEEGEAKSDNSEASDCSVESVGEFSQYQRASLASHNQYRARHGAAALVLDRKLCDLAQAWAEELLASNKFQHRPGSKLGENIFSSWSSATKIKLKASDPVDSWYREVEKYNYESETGNAGTGHFTQVVWAASTKLGVGVSSHNGKVIVVANYDPPGNFRGKFHKNVFKPKN